MRAPRRRGPMPSPAAATAVRTAVVVGVLLAAGSAVPSRAESGDGSYDVGYLWTPHLDGALEYRDLVAEQLGPDVGAHLEIVLGGSGNYGLIYDRDATDVEEARRVANAHHRILHGAFGGDDLLADVLADRGFERLFDLRLGGPGTLERCRERYDQLLVTLDAQRARQLIVERTATGDHAVRLVLYLPREDAARLGADLGGVVVPSGGGGAVLDGTTVSGVSTGAAGRPAPVAGTEAGAGSGPAPASEGTAGAPGGEEAAAPRFDVMDRPLRDAVNDHIQALRARGVVAADERTAWVVYDLGQDRTLVAINADTPLQCASMVKPFVALAFFHEVEAGRFIYGPRSTAHLEAMLQRSSNADTNWFIDTMGGVERVRAILREGYGDLLPGLELVEAIPPGGATYRNRATAADYARFLRALWRDELPGAGEIRRAMNLPNRDRIYTGVPEIPVGTAVIDKTGTTARLVGDMGILVARDGDGGPVPYVIVGIVEKESRHPRLHEFARSRGDVIRGVSALVYRALRDERRLR